jgi:predicted TIM-barrel fold metal-dependent hydrolase
VTSSASAGEAALCLPPTLPRRRPDFPLPKGACDSHLHVFAADAPLTAPRNYTPQILTLDDWLVLAAFLGIERGVLVQPSVYGRDNGVLLAALKAALDRLRGVVVVDPDISDQALRHLDSVGVRGVRINMRNVGGLALDTADTLARRIAPLGWHLQFQVGPSSYADLAGMLPRLAVPVVIDHIGLVPLDHGAEGALRDLLRLIESGRCHIKLSGAYRVAPAGRRSGLATIVAALVSARPDRLLWGTDWPHTELWEGMPDDAGLVDEAMTWLADDATRTLVCVSNPAALYWRR